MKKILSLILSIYLLLCQSSSAVSALEYIDDSLDIEVFLQTNERNVELRQRQSIAHQMAECARALGYPEEHPVIEAAQAEWYISANQIEINNQQAIFWEAKFDQYPAATYWWLFLTKELDYSDAVTAGIIGNMMVEVGGKTLNLKPTIYSVGGYYYGSCQWNRFSYPDVQGANLKTQCQFLADTIEPEIDSYGWLYAHDYTYKQFIALTSAREAALMFAKAYERCSSMSYIARKNCAQSAYDYFTTN